MRHSNALQIVHSPPGTNYLRNISFGLAPTDGEFKGVHTLGQMVKHFSATNHILPGAALAEKLPADAGDEMRPKTARTKAEMLGT
jgi:hypothetical protein